MDLPAQNIVREIKVIIAKRNPKAKSPDLVPDAWVRIFMTHHPDEVRALMEKFAQDEEPPAELAGWTAERVKEVIVLAFEMLEQTEGKVGPAKLKAAGIEISDSWGYAPDFTRTSPFAGAMTISRMERILIGVGRAPSWLNGELLKYPDERAKLIAWAMSRLGGPTVHQICKRRKWPKWTFYRHVNKAAGIVAKRLNREKVEVF